MSVSKVIAVAAAAMGLLAVLAGPAGAAPDVLATAIEVARRDHPDLDEDKVRSRIDALAERYRALVPEGAEPAERAEAFAALLFDEEGFRSVDDLDTSATLHVDTVLDRRRGHCLSLSVVALAVAERTGEPLHVVALPNHVFVRWDDGAFRRNLELTRRGEEIGDDELKARMGDFWRPDSLYLRNLSVTELRGVLLHNRGFVALQSGRREDAMADLRAALGVVPDLPEAHRNLGVLHGEAGRWGPAIAAFERALELYPGDADALLNLALARHASGDTPGALADLEILALISPGHPRVADLEATWRREADGAPARERPSGVKPGLHGRYYRGTAFEELVAQSVARDLDFDWKRSPPRRGVPRDRFSARWEGWFHAREPGRYTFFVVSNDGVRIQVGPASVVDHWETTGYTSWTGTGDVELATGWHPIRVEYFDQSDNARLFCLVSRKGDEYPLELRDHLFHRP